MDYLLTPHKLFGSGVGSQTRHEKEMPRYNLSGRMSLIHFKITCSNTDYAPNNLLEKLK